MVDMNGSTTVMATAVATAASTALPPRARMRGTHLGAARVLGGDHAMRRERRLLGDDEA